MMRWEDERYVRIYTRDTADWLALSFDAQALFCLLLRKVDRAGLLPLGKHGKRAVAAVLGQTAIWEQRLAPALEDLLADGCVRIEGNTLVVPNFIEAQEATQSDAQRKRESRARARDQASPEKGGQSQNVTECPDPSQNVTTESQNVTVCPEMSGSGHNVSQVVTPYLAVPSRAVPSEKEAAAARARAEGGDRGSESGAGQQSAPLPSRAEAECQRWPLLTSLAEALGPPGGPLQLPNQAQSSNAMEATLLRFGVDAVAQRCRELIELRRASGHLRRMPRHVAYFEGLLEEMREAGSVAAKPGTGPPKPKAFAPAAPPEYFGSKTRTVQL